MLFGELQDLCKGYLQEQTRIVSCGIVQQLWTIVVHR